jgi:hypothetical protein
MRGKIIVGWLKGIGFLITKIFNRYESQQYSPLSLLMPKPKINSFL